MIIVPRVDSQIVVPEILDAVVDLVYLVGRSSRWANLSSLSQTFAMRKIWPDEKFHSKGILIFAIIIRLWTTIQVIKEIERAKYFP